MFSMPPASPTLSVKLSAHYPFRMAPFLLVDSVAGMEVGTEVAWRYADEFNLPRFVVINKLDRENANFAKALRIR